MNRSTASADPSDRPDLAVASTATVATACPGLATIRLNGMPTPAVSADGFVLPLAEAARRGGAAGAVPASSREALAEWDRWTSVILRAAADGVGGPGWLPEAEVEFLPALADPPTVYCAAANYRDHVKEMRSTADAVPTAPMFFLVPPASLAGHREPVVRPDGVQQLDWEVELAVVIGREASSVSAADADAVIAGYTVANDLSVRDFARRSDYPFFPDWFSMKSYTGCMPLGPAIVPADSVPDPMDLYLGLTVNGEKRQASNTRNMIFSIAEQIEYLSRIVTLQPGDVILTGTPAGTGRSWGRYLSPDDVMVAEVEGLGRLETRVATEAGGDGR
ncbi:fumarylacetoacetate hydrolase family protein [Actinospica sp.]|uniref:fumarylacetoacetate hydrolase family protein n=1 Tax=Actinospica sp. TaxID=1872142 RepID=UPI002C5F625E|nr:fumarylacetoacetate hydrolase family protein [Actinospica sp.]HWG25574.1 fumarylacetoacetate hydrolase family protein [Actinospica sp.]